MGHCDHQHCFASILSRVFVILFIVLLVILLTSCSGGDSNDSTDNPQQPPPNDDDTVQPIEVHKSHFTETAYSGTADCIECHQSAANHIITTGHWNWQGTASQVEGHESGTHGKNNMINNFCIAVQSNEGRCSQCHIGYGYADNSFNFSDVNSIDCLVCHDQSGSYKKSKTAAGAADDTVDLNSVAQSVGENNGVPQRKNCIACHATAGGGDNVKHGDLSTALVNTTREYDVHMASDGGDFSCVECHDVERTTDGNPLDHGIAGMPFHSVDEGNMKTCTDCHGDNDVAHQNQNMGNLFYASNGNPRHERLACQVCHIPGIARQIATKTDWDWSTAGQDIDPVPIDPVSGRPTYDKKKGHFIWGMNVRPVLRVHNGKWQRMMVNVNDQYTSTPVVLAEPAASAGDATAKIYPFKRMTGKQVADATNHTLLVPHLFGMAGGPNPYWVSYDWHLALLDGASYTGQTYSNSYEFVDTVMYLTVNHEIPPGNMALGEGGDCGDCHESGEINWPALGWAEDPYKPGGGP